ncbi:MAG: NeuD/PglB/VioB family sugar acetyltransferase [Anaerolineaceae bacterium]|nr:NeuD/PglB/VioB family sugar acetyltransferase [Anaerolineaceae bacterium]
MNKNFYPKFGFDPTKVVIYGGGGLSKMIIEAVRVLGCYQIVGVIDDNLKKGTEVIGSPVLGGAETLVELKKDGIRLAVNSVGGIGNYKTRLDVFNNLAEAGFVCPVIVHPTAHIDPSAKLEAGVLVLAQSYVSGNARIGMGSLINNSVVVSHDCVLGVCTNLSPGAKIAGDVTIDDFTQIGMNATVNIGVKIGKECLIGNGATVKKDVPQKTRVYAGSTWPKYTPRKNRAI